MVYIATTFVMILLGTYTGSAFLDLWQHTLFNFNEIC